MARVVVTYTPLDGRLAERISTRLAEDFHHSVLRLQPLRLEGDQLKDRAIVEFERADFVIAILSRNSWSSRDYAFDLGLVRAYEASQNRQFLIGLLVDDAPIPSVLGPSQVVRVDVRALGDALTSLDLVLRRPALPPVPEPRLAFGQAAAFIQSGEPVPAWASKINELRKALLARALVLFLGAGVSASAEVPTWTRLVDTVVGRALNGIRLYMPPGLTPEELARLFRLRTNAADLVLAQHAQRELGKAQFYDVVRSAPYARALHGSDLLGALGDVVESGRARSAVTYNFDDLLEEELRGRGCRFDVISHEGQRARENAFAIYHVHGWIPRRGKFRLSDIVFAENEFNSESLDPYRWSALLQISQLSHATCLFVGASIQDPNLRRLLSVVKTRSAEDVSEHFVICTRTAPEDIEKDAPALPTTSTSQAARLIDLLREADMNGLGLQVLWVDSRNEVPDVVRALTVP